MTQRRFPDTAYNAVTFQWTESVGFAVPLSATGKALSKDCTSCHTILYQGTAPTPTTLDVIGMAFEHPAEIGEAWKEMNCKDCHAGQ